MSKPTNGSKKRKAAAIEEETQKPEADQKPPNPFDSIRHCIVTNDNDPTNLVRLIGLKSLFAKQLPKMPKEYILRLVFDRRHKSLALLSNDPLDAGGDEEIIGGICYRPYPDMKFAEIAFCAVNSSQQVKGYGTKLMNLLKQHAVTEGVEYLITYADNYAIGYFKKQGFSRTITMSRTRYHGLIKDYDGGTMMECYIHPSIDYTRIPEMLKAQKKFILDRIRATSKSDKIIYDPLPKNWAPDTTNMASVRGNEVAARALAIPGVQEAGWTMSDLIAATTKEKSTLKQKNNLKSEYLAITQKIEDQQFAWPFRQPVDPNEVEGYEKIVTKPMDLSTIDKKIREGKYDCKQHLYLDLKLMVDNCKKFNPSSSPYFECAVNLENYLATLFPSC